MLKAGKKVLKGANERGFTLFELLIAMFIIVILISVALPQYLGSVRSAKETVLRENLYQMRKIIDQYSADKGKMPQSLDDLINAGYLREIPIDPMTEKADWQTETGEDINSAKGESGIKNVRSSSDEISAEGVPYNEF